MNYNLYSRLALFGNKPCINNIIILFSDMMHAKFRTCHKVVLYCLIYLKAMHISSVGHTFTYSLTNSYTVKQPR